MKKTIFIDDEAKATAKGRKTSAIVHAVLIGLLVFPFMHMSSEEKLNDVQIVMDFSSGSSQEGARMTAKNTALPKKVDKPQKAAAKPVLVTEQEETVEMKAQPKQDNEMIKVPETTQAEEIATEEAEVIEEEVATGMGSGDKGEGDADEGSAASGNGKGFIEGSGVLTRAVIDRGNTKELAQQNGTLVLKICINRRGLVTFAEWDKEASTIKDSKVARTALDNILEYRFEKDRNAPTKECGRLTYIIDVD